MGMPDSKKKAPNVFFTVGDDGVTLVPTTHVPTVIPVINIPPPPVIPIFTGKNTLVPLVFAGLSRIFHANKITTVPLTFGTNDNAFYSNKITTVPLTLGTTDNAFYSSIITTVPLILAGITPPPPPVVVEYVTSALYPFLITDTLAVNPLTYKSGSGYTMPIQLDTFRVSPLSAIGGTLVETIVYINYTVPDSLTIGPLSAIGGTLVETIVYIPYTNGIIENLQINQLTLQSGSLV